jgi:hypothetical protein
VHAVTNPGQVVVNLDVITQDPETDRRRIDALGAAYVQLHRTTSRPTVPPEPPILDRLRARRNALTERFDEVKAELTRLGPLAEGRVIERRNALVGELDENRDRWVQAVDAYGLAVRRFIAARDEEAPTGTVDAEGISQAEANTAALGEDKKELLVRLAEIHEMLAEAVTAVDGERDVLIQALDELKSALAREREKQPELAVAAVLERIEVAATDLRAVTETFGQAWSTEAATLTPPTRAAEAQPLLTRQAALQRLVGEYLLDVEPFREQLFAHVASLADGGDGLTQRIVVQNALRGPVDAVRTSGDRLSQSAGTAVRQTNFRLDAACRGATRLAGRVTGRRAEIRADLQRQADRQAAEQHADNVAALQTTMNEHETKRDQALRDLLVTTREILELDAPFRVGLESRALLSVVRRDADALSRELASLDDTLPAAPTEVQSQIDSAADEVSYAPAVVEVIPRTSGRLRPAVTALVLTLCVTLLVAVALTAALPMRADDES